MSEQIMTGWFERGHGSLLRRYGVVPRPVSSAVPTWYSNGETTAQLSHFAWGAFVVLAVSLHTGPLWPLCVGAAVAVVKEFGVDSWLSTAWGGEGDSWSASTLDFVMYLLGGGAGWLAWSWR